MTPTELPDIANFSIRYCQYLNANSEVVQPFPEHITTELLVRLYRQMSLTRALDNKAINLQRTGKMGTYAASIGQEAVSVGVGYAMQKSDIYCAAYRDQGTLMQRGVKMSEILRYWGGDERANHYANNTHDFPPCVPIATQCLHAAGVAYAVQYRDEARAVVVTIGDGGTSKGDFYESLNIAGCWQLPLVTVVNNNRYAISLPLSQQTACQTLAQKAIAAGIEGIQVDGNDIIAVLDAMQYALHKARNGQGPTVIETVSYRLGDHTTADDAARYREKTELQQAWTEEPIRRLGKYLEAEGAWSKIQETALLKECNEVVQKAATVYLKQKPQAPTDIIDYLYETLPAPLIEQRNQIKESQK